MTPCCRPPAACPTQTLFFTVLPKTWPSWPGPHVPHACCANTPISSAHLNASHAGAACHQKAATRAPTSCVPMQLAGCCLRLAWAGPVLQGVPPAAQQLQTSSGLGKPGGCSAVQWAATTPSRRVDPRPGVAALLPSVLPQPQVLCSFLQSLFTKV